MDNISSLLPPPPPAAYPTNTFDNENILTGQWQTVSAQSLHNQLPCPRSLHSAATWGDKMLVFGGYDVSLFYNTFDFPL
jgi:hypothetical protein